MPTVPPMPIDLTVTDAPEVAAATASAAGDFERIARELDHAAGDDAGLAAAFASFDDRRRRWLTDLAGVRLRYLQDTTDGSRVEAKGVLDAGVPQVATAEKAVKQRLLASPARPSLEARLGPQAFACWGADAEAHDASIAADLVREKELENAYTSLVSTATVERDGAPQTLSEIAPRLQSHDRETRHAAERDRWSIFAAHRERLDELFGELVTVRDRMARARGFGSFVELGYRRLHRIDYTAHDVARFREAVVRDVVPLASRVVARLGRERGLDRVALWDEGTLATHPSLAPAIARERFVSAGIETLGALDPSLAEFGDFMRERDLFDVAARPGKAFGAFCTMFPSHGSPFVFANFTGAPSDVRTLMHELGHAFQGYRSRSKVAVDYLSPTYDAAEIHSMALEYLSWPQMERFFGASADAYRREHVLHALLFLPYAAAVDHFQHLVYAHPSATPAERNAMWQDLERTYLPWRDYGDLAHPLAGGLWQGKRHIFLAPFYYIDYALALTCALQFWQRAETDRGTTLDAYVALCSRGGEAPFRELVRSAGLASPFEDGLDGPVAAIRRTFAAAS